MRILISLSYYVPNISGLTNYAKILAEELSKKGHEITVLTSQHEENLLLHEKKNGVKIIRTPMTFRIGKGPIMLSFPFKAWKHVRKADIVNCHLPQFESLILAFLAKVNRKELILTYQTDLSWSGGLLLKTSKVFLLISHFISAIIANKIIVLSEDYAMHSWFLKLFSKKLAYIYPPVKLIEPSGKALEIFETSIKLKRKYVIGVLTRISPEKGIEYLLETIPFLRNALGDNFVIVIAGPAKPIGESSYIHKIDALFKKYNNFVEFMGNLKDEDLASFYKCLDVFVLPSINSTEAFGMVQVEAMLCGIPVIASELPGVRVPISVTKMGKLAKIKDPIDLANSIIEVLLNKKKYTIDKKYIEKTFSLIKIVDLYEKLFSRTIDL
jgi:glycosyltransferase involved in cell wall biosynthesis